MRIRRRVTTATVVAVVGDLHINSTVGIVPPGVRLDDGGCYILGPEQGWIWNRWREFWDEVHGIARNRELVVVLNGDLIEGNHHRTTQVVTANEETQARMALSVLRPVTRLATRLYVVRGTEAHVGPAAQWEELLASHLDAERGGGGAASHWHLCMVASGVKFDIGHHPRTAGYMPHTRVSAPGRMARMVRTEYQEDGLDPPDVVIRSHTHHFDRGFAEGTDCIYAPGWQLTTAYGYRRGAGYRIEPIGGLVFVCQDGAYEFHPFRYRAPRENPWKQ